MTLGATAIAAGVIGKDLVATPITRKDVASQLRRTALEHVSKGAEMAWQHALAIRLEILVAVSAQNVRYFQHH